MVAYIVSIDEYLDSINIILIDCLLLQYYFIRNCIFL